MSDRNLMKNIEVNFGELSQALVQLGYKILDEGENVRFVHKKSGSRVLIKKREPSKNIWHPIFVATSNELVLFGILEDQADLAKLIEKNRLATAQKAAA